MHILILIWFFFFPTAHAEPSWNQGKERISVFVPANPSRDQKWHSTSNVYTDVYYAYKDRGIGQELARHAAKTTPQIARQLGIGSGSAFKIYIMPTQESFERLQPGRFPDWADGTAWPSLGLIFLRSPDIRDGRSDPLTQVLDHEIAHILLGRAFANRPVPRWLQEGVAQIVAGEYGHSSVDTISQGVLGGELLSLRELSQGFPKSPFRARLAYAQSADFVLFLQKNYGTHSIQKLIYYMSHQYNFDQSVQMTTGKSVEELDLEWRGDLSSSMLWLKPLVSDTALLSVGGFLLIFGFVRSIRNRRLSRNLLLQENEVYDALEREFRNWRPNHLLYRID